MKPIDFRYETYASLQGRISGQRAGVLNAWKSHGPGTTAQLAERSGISILNIRPRTTELFELGFVVLTEAQPEKGEGTYRAASPAEVIAYFRRRQSAALTPQTELPLTARSS